MKRRHGTARLATFALALLLDSAAHAQTGGLRFRLTDLEGNFKGKTVPTLSVAYAINTSGQITGDLVYGNNQYCFLYSPGAAGVTFTSAAASTLWCDARAINSTGWLTGAIYMPNAGLVNAFRRSPSSGKIWNYPSIYAAFTGEVPFNSFGWGIDDSINVVGEMDAFFPNNPGPVDQAAYSWNSAGTPIPLTPLQPDYYSQELATSGSGAYVAVYNPDIFLSAQPALAPQFIGLNAYCGYWGYSSDPAAAVPYAVNNQGHAVGSSFCAYNDPYNHATLWGSQGVVDLGFEPSIAYALSSDDWVVGNSKAWSTGAGWKVVQAYGINTVHQIVGQAADSKGRLHAVLLTPDNKQSACVY